MAAEASGEEEEAAEQAGAAGREAPSGASGAAAPATAPALAADAAAAPGREAAQEPEQPCYGRVKSYNYAKGFGFLECPPLSARFGRDVFLRKEAVLEEVLLGRIASGSGPKAAVQRGDILVRFALVVNEAGNPEARDVREVKRAAIPQEFLEGLAPASAKAAAPTGKGPAGREARAAAGGEAVEKEAAEGRKKPPRGGGAGGQDGDDPGKVGPYRYRVGRSAEENWELLTAAKNKHWFFHLTDYPSAYVILECEREPSEEEKLRCAEICRNSSKMKLSGAIKVDATVCGNVGFNRKKDVVGECTYKKDKLVEIITVP